MTTYDKLKTILNRDIVDSPNFRVEGTAQFAQLLKDTIDLRNLKIEQINTFVRNEISAYYRLNNRSSSFMNNLCKRALELPLNIAIIGRLNAGKSMLTSHLIDHMVTLPSTDEPTTGRITRLVYSEEWSLKVIKINANEYGKVKSTLIYETELNSDNAATLLEQYIQVSSSRHYDNYTEGCIIEIGLPSLFLKPGVQIIDCPGFDNDKTISKYELKLIKRLSPSLILYVYDYNQGFNMPDATALDVFLSEIEDGEMSNRDLKHYAEFILVANKIDEINRSILDSTDGANIPYFDSINCTASVRDNSHFKLSYGHKRYKIDIDRLLPVLPLSTGALYIYKHTENATVYNEWYLNLLQQILVKLGNQPRLLIDCFAYYLADSYANELQKDQEIVNFNLIELWFKFKSLSIQDDLTQLIVSLCQGDQFLLLNFQHNYKIYGLIYKGDHIQVTSVSTADDNFRHQEIVKIYRELFSRAAIVMECLEKSMIYIISKQMPHSRLIDCLHEYSLHDMETFINQIAEEELLNTSINTKPNFRPDNIYVGRQTLHVNRTVPNDPSLPLMLKNKIPSQPFHLNPSLKSKYPYSWESIETINEFFYCFGCFIWILMEGTGKTAPVRKVNNKEELLPDKKDWLELLSFGRNPSYPKYLRKAMLFCWKSEWKSHDQQYNYQFNKLYWMIASNFWIRNNSYNLDSDLIAFIKSNCSDDATNCFDFTNGYKIFTLMYRDYNIHVTSLSNFGDKVIHFQKEKERIYEERYKDSDLMIYESEDESNIYLIDNFLPGKRLMDNICDLKLDDVISIIKQAAELNKDLNKLQPNFRADSLFLSDSLELYINKNIPNYENLPFLMKDKIQAPPFHLHPLVREYQINKNDTLEEKVRIMGFLYNFGWLVWLLTDATGSDYIDLSKETSIDKCIADLKPIRFFSYPDYLKEILQLCWSNMDERKWNRLTVTDLQRLWDRIKALLDVTDDDMPVTVNL